MKKWKRWAIAALSAIMLLNIVACGGGATSASQSGNSDSGSVNGSSTTEWDKDVAEVYAPKDTAYKLVEKGKTAYKLLLPASMSAAAETVTEMKNFIAECTGINILTVKDDNFTYDSNAQVISLGNTTAARTAGVTTTYDEFGTDGYYIKTVDKSVFINASNTLGLLNGVYDFLRFQFGVKIYSYDEMTTPKTSDLNLKDFDYKGIPDFKVRCHGVSWNSPTTYSQQYEKRMRLGVNNGSGWIGFAHTHFSLLPKETYYEAHSDWYSEDGTQLCLSNEEMRAELIKVMKDKLEDTSLTWTDTYYFMLGQMDVNTFCGCERCTAEAAANGGNSGVMMKFINWVADTMNPYVEEKYPDVTIYWVTFAYGKTLDAPVKKVDGKFVPYNDDVVAHEKVGIMLAPLGADFYHDLLDEKYNPQSAECLPGWESIKSHLFIWTYNSVFDNAFYFMDDFDVLRQNYQHYKDIGAFYIYDQGNYGAENAMPFQAMSMYIRAQLMWDLDSDVNAMMNEFMDAYYKDGSTYVRQYYHALKKRYQDLDDEYAARGEYFHLKSYLRTTSYDTEEFWPKSWLENTMAILDKGIEAASKMADKDAGYKARIRIQNEKASLVHHIIALYNDEMSISELSSYIETFEKYCTEGNIKRYKEHPPYSTEGLINDWKTLLVD